MCQLDGSHSTHSPGQQGLTLPSPPELHIRPEHHNLTDTGPFTPPDAEGGPCASGGTALTQAVSLLFSVGAP